MTIMQKIMPVDEQVEFFSVELKNIEQLEQDANRQLFEWWLESGNGFAPRWTDFDILAFARFSKHITLTERIDQKRFKFKIQGERTLELLGRDRLYKAEIHPDHNHAYERDLYDHYDRICREAKPYVYTGSLPELDRGYVRLESIDLPFHSSNGDVDKILSMLVEFTKG